VGFRYAQPTLLNPLSRAMQSRYALSLGAVLLSTVKAESKNYDPPSGVIRAGGVEIESARIGWGRRAVSTC